MVVGGKEGKWVNPIEVQVIEVIGLSNFLDSGEGESLDAWVLGGCITDREKAAGKAMLAGWGWRQWVLRAIQVDDVQAVGCGDLELRKDILTELFFFSNL
jgi:hypothetical protein